MSTACRPVLQAEYGMHVQCGVSVIANCDVSDDAQHLGLLIHVDRVVLPRLKVEPANFGAFESTEGRQRSTGNTLALGKCCNRSKSLLTRRENQDKGSFIHFRRYDFMLHSNAPFLPVAIPVEVPSAIFLSDVLHRV